MGKMVEPDVNRKRYLNESEMQVKCDDNDGGSTEDRNSEAMRNKTDVLSPMREAHGTGWHGSRLTSVSEVDDDEGDEQDKAESIVSIRSTSTDGDTAPEEQVRALAKQLGIGYGKKRAVVVRPTSERSERKPIHDKSTGQPVASMWRKEREYEEYCVMVAEARSRGESRVTTHVERALTMESGCERMATHGGGALAKTQVAGGHIATIGNGTNGKDERTATNGGGSLAATTGGTAPMRVNGSEGCNTTNDSDGETTTGAGGRCVAATGGHGPMSATDGDASIAARIERTGGPGRGRRRGRGRG